MEGVREASEAQGQAVLYRLRRQVPAKEAHDPGEINPLESEARPDESLDRRQQRLVGDSIGNGLGRLLQQARRPRPQKGKRSHAPFIVLLRA